MAFAALLEDIDGRPPKEWSAASAFSRGCLVGYGAELTTEVWTDVQAVAVPAGKVLPAVSVTSRSPISSPVAGLIMMSTGFLYPDARSRSLCLLAVKVRLPVYDGGSGNERGRFVKCSAEVGPGRLRPPGRPRRLLALRLLDCLACLAGELCPGGPGRRGAEYSRPRPRRSFPDEMELTVDVIQVISYAQ
jgi:hypothetical protein